MDDFAQNQSNAITGVPMSTACGPKRWHHLPMNQARISDRKDNARSRR